MSFISVSTSKYPLSLSSGFNIRPPSFLSCSENHLPHPSSSFKDLGAENLFKLQKTNFTFTERFSPNHLIERIPGALVCFQRSPHWLLLCCLALLSEPGCSFAELLLFQAFRVVEEKKKIKQNNFLLWAKHKLGNWADKNAHWSRGEWICNLNYCGIKASSSLCSLI